MVKIMVIDDSRFIRIFVRRIVEKEGYEVVCEASRGREAIELIDKCKPNIVILDINMPDMSGLDVLNVIKSRWPSINVVMLTALDQPWAIEMAKRMGAQYFIPKPISPQRLIGVIKSIAR